MVERQYFSKGDKVEVSRGDGSSKATWLPATVLRSSSKKRQIYVEFQILMPHQNGSSKRLREFVDSHNVRPVPPVELHRCFMVGDNVDAYHHDGAWRQGTVVDILENSRYSVLFDGSGERVECEQWGLRIHRQWDDGSWVPPLEEQKNSSELEMKSSGVKLKFKYNGRTSDTNFSKGTMVEVKSEEEGYYGSWYTAVIFGSIGNGKFLVEYQTLTTDDETELLKEEVDVQCIRPCPPDVKQTDTYKRFEEVDAWYNDGWWVGLVLKVLDDFKYVIYFWTTNEQLEFEHSDLRPHQEWIDGKWFTGSGRKSSRLEVKFKEEKFKIKCCGGTSEVRFAKGTMVEVKSDEEGYQGSWYTAVIIGPVGNDKFLVEYQTLKTDDETDPLKEEAHALYIRPCPPAIHRVDCFKPLEEVDAWYNDGWWMGLISKVLDDLKYRVYFGTTNEELEFVHSNLRPHQEWTDGKWVISSWKTSSELVKLREFILERYYGGRTPVASFSMGTMVEVRSDEEGYRGSWYTAVIVGLRGRDKFLVEYQTLRTDDEAEPLKEEAHALNIRPCPPEIQWVDRFKLHEEIDAWYNDGWWVGRVSKVLDGLKYMVYFGTTNEELEFKHSYLRPHQEWTGGKWVVSSRV